MCRYQDNLVIFLELKYLVIDYFLNKVAKEVFRLLFCNQLPVVRLYLCSLPNSSVSDPRQMEFLCFSLSASSCIVHRNRQ